MSGALRTSFAVIIVATLAGMAGYYSSLPQSVPLPTLPAPSAGAAERLGKLKLPDLEGKEQSLLQWRGKVLVVNFWATWCPPCRAEIPEFARISKENALNNVQFVGIGMDSAESIRAFKRETEIPYPTLIGDPGSMDLVTDLGNRANGLPFTVILHRDGSIHQVKLGAMPGLELEEALASALNRH